MSYLNPVTVIIMMPSLPTLHCGPVAHTCMRVCVRVHVRLISVEGPYILTNNYMYLKMKIVLRDGEGGGGASHCECIICVKFFCPVRKY